MEIILKTQKWKNILYDRFLDACVIGGVNVAIANTEKFCSGALGIVFELRCPKLRYATLSDP